MIVPQNLRRIPAKALRRIKLRVAEERTVLKAGVASLLGSKVDRPALFRGLSDEAWFHLNTRAYRRQSRLRELLPGMPNASLQSEFIGSDGDKALREAWRAYRVWIEMAARHGRPIDGSSRVLDFGCGWGRMLRFFLREVPAEQLCGVDVLPEALEACRSTNPWCQFQKVSPLPPTELPADSFDLIYLYSVFSHLSEDAHRLWLKEFHRILKPGGLVIATTWDREYIQRCANARQGDARGTHLGSVLAFPDTADALARYDRGEYCYSPIGGRTALDSEFYGETCIPEAYARREWSWGFDIPEFLYADRKRLWQHAIVARKR